MIQLHEFTHVLDDFFQLEKIGPDPAFKRFIPMVYDPISYPWKERFAPRFTQLFNGLMVQGEEQIHTIFLAVFPTHDVLQRFIDAGEPGDLLFMHHPLVMECGDPRGRWGRGFVPIDEIYIQQIKDKGLSIYTCHVPLDVHPQVSTSLAIAESLSASIAGSFCATEHGAFGYIANIPACSTDDLIREACALFQIPYADFEGPQHDRVDKVAIIAGCGDKVAWMKEAESKGAKAYLTGEIHCHVDNDYGRTRYRQMMEYVADTSMSLIGVSHAASEYLVMKTQIKRWFEEEFPVQIQLLPQRPWWL
ncbi:Nif3-like dinuclear metal center hexameric protein [Laceyella putida]|uniref:GTP cyclohydrolase 1 type 2 homolog n=1 Tax=Laceyella putida TaxID=110101 RepID=A0ABW2RPE1_9BACL